MWEVGDLMNQWEAAANKIVIERQICNRPPSPLCSVRAENRSKSTASRTHDRGTPFALRVRAGRVVGDRLRRPQAGLQATGLAR